MTFNDHEDLLWEKATREAVLLWAVRILDVGADRWATLQEELAEHFDVLMVDGSRLELKIRRSKYVNKKDILIETESCVEKRTLGWIYTTQANFLVYAFVTPGREVLKGYIFDFPELQAWWIKEGTRTNYENKYGKTGDLYTTKNCVVPLGDLPLEVFAYHPDYGRTDYRTGYKIE